MEHQDKKNKLTSWRLIHTVSALVQKSKFLAQNERFLFAKKGGLPVLAGSLHI